MYRLAKVGFSQSYTYFTWRRHKQELTEYFTELSHPPVSEFFRPNVWPNTPDILHETLQTGGRPMFEARFVMAATLAASYGIYGPAFELLEHVPREPGSEEYLNSEKYEIRAWDLEQPDSLAPLIREVNRIRREHPALQSNERLVFHDIDDDALLAYTKRSADGQRHRADRGQPRSPRPTRRHAPAAPRRARPGPGPRRRRDRPARRRSRDAGATTIRGSSSCRANGRHASSS